MLSGNADVKYFPGIWETGNMVINFTSVIIFYKHFIHLVTIAIIQY
jgi:hypothetical protein